MGNGFLQNLLDGLNLGAISEVGDGLAEIGKIDMTELNETISGISGTLAELESSVLVFAAILKSILFVIIGIAVAKLVVLVIVMIKQCKMNKRMKKLEEKIDRMTSQQILLDDSSICEENTEN